MSHREHLVGRIIPEDVDDDRRLYECARKYETIVKQFDELLGIMSNDTAIPTTKRRKSRRGSGSDGRTSVSLCPPNKNEAIVRTVTRFLRELGTNPSDSDSSTT